MCDEDGEWRDAEEEELAFWDGYYTVRCYHRIFGEWDSPRNVCFKRRHTSNPKEVKYHIGQGEYYDGDEKLNFTSRNRVLTCCYKGCKPVST